MRPKGTEAPHPFPHTLPYSSLPTGCSSTSFITAFHNKQGDSFSEFYEQQIDPMQGGGKWEPLIYSQSVRSTGNNLDLQMAPGDLGWGPWNLQPIIGSRVRSTDVNLGLWMAPERRVVLWDGALYLWNLMLSPGRQKRIELNCKTSSWCMHCLWYVEGRSPPSQHPLELISEPSSYTSF